MTKDEINKILVDKTIKMADVDGYGIELTFSDGTVFTYSSSDGGYSSWEIERKDLISRKEAIKKMDKVMSSGTDLNWAFADILNNLPAAERVGEWKIDEYGIYHCPFCQAINNTVYKSYCPNCGARMRGAE